MQRKGESCEKRSNLCLTGAGSARGGRQVCTTRANARKSADSDVAVPEAAEMLTKRIDRVDFRRPA